MLNFKSYASGSTGNLYTVDDGKTKVLIEMGLPIAKLKKALSYGLSKVSFALLTHSHADHSKGVKEVMRAGIDTYTSQGTIDALGLSGHRIHAVRANKQYKIEDWVILPLETIHDAPEPLSFLITSSSGERIFFATDTAYIKNLFVDRNGKAIDINILAVECNYETSLLDQNIESGLCEPGLKKRLLETHLSLDNVIEFLKANDLKAIRNICLLHLSSRNANPQQMKTEVEKATGKPVYICGGNHER